MGLIAYFAVLLNRVGYFNLSLTVLIIALEFRFFLAIIKCDRVNRSSIIPLEKVKTLLESTSPDEIDVEWVKYLYYCLILEGKKSLSEIKEIIQGGLSSGMERLHFLTNVGPAAGLAATFIGMVVVLFDISALTGNGQEQAIYRSLSGLYPVFLGSLSGILVYISGSFYQRKAEQRAASFTDEYISIYLKKEKEIAPRSLNEVREVTENLLRPTQLLLNKFKQVNKGFENFISFTESFDSKARSMIHEFGRTMQQVETPIKALTVSVEHHTDLVDTTLKQIANYNSDMTRAVNEWERVVGTFTSISEKFAEITGRFERAGETIGQLLVITGQFQEALNRIEKRDVDLEKLFESVKSYGLQIQSYIDALRNLDGRIDGYRESTVGELTSLRTAIGELPHNISKLNEAILPFSNLPVDTYQKFRQDFENIKDSLSRVSVLQGIAMQINELVVGFDSLNKTFEKISISGISKVEQNLASIREQQKLFEESNQQAIKQFADAFAGNYQSLRDDMKLILNTIKHKHSNPVPHVSESDNIFETLFAFENSPVLRFFYKHLFNKS